MGVWDSEITPIDHANLHKARGVTIHITERERERKTDPAKKAATVKVAYKAELELELTFESTLPAAPKPLRALKEPGHMKQIKPRRHTWVTGW